MKDKQIIKCKYKFQDKEKFNGQSYCTLHNEICKDLSFVCDTNCQVYEDYKQLSAKEQECERLTSKCSQLEEENEKLQKEKENYCFDCDVAERMRKVTYAATGGRLSYANYTVEAIEQAYNDQLRIDVEYRTKELEEEIDQLKAENEDYKKRFDKLYNLSKQIISEKFKLGCQCVKLKQTLIDIKEIAEGCQYGDCHECKYQPRMDCRTELIAQILNKISESEVNNG